jgi:hypothetical protein
MVDPVKYLPSQPFTLAWPRLQTVLWRALFDLSFLLLMASLTCENAQYEPYLTTPLCLPFVSTGNSEREKSNLPCTVAMVHRHPFNFQQL